MAFNAPPNLVSLFHAAELFQRLADRIVLVTGSEADARLLGEQCDAMLHRLGFAAGVRDERQKRAGMRAGAHNQVDRQSRRLSVRVVVFCDDVSVLAFKAEHAAAIGILKLSIEQRGESLAQICRSEGSGVTGSSMELGLGFVAVRADSVADVCRRQWMRPIGDLGRGRRRRDGIPGDSHGEERGEENGTGPPGRDFQ